MRSGFSGRCLSLFAFCFAVAPVSAEDLKNASAVDDSSLASLGQRIDAHLAEPAFDDALWGVQVVSLDTGKTLYSHNADKLFVPASTAKLYTAALALDTFGPDYKVPTSLFATEK
ncbi:MAG: D-alanyl-D-alanine carboxypeptidase, partial [Dokdonella sp.]